MGFGVVAGSEQDGAAQPVFEAGFDLEQTGGGMGYLCKKGGVQIDFMGNADGEG